MSIKTTPVQPVRVTYVCNTCETGEMVYAGSSTTMGYDSYHNHYCSRCMTQAQLNTIYPYIEYEDITK